MKKVLVLFAFILLLGGCGVQKKSTPPLPDLNFSGNISVTYNDFDLVCSIENKLASECVITVLEPELISGLKMVVKDGNCSLKLGDISYDIDSSALKNTEFASTLVEAFEQILTTSTYQKLESGNWLYSGQTSIGEFNLVQDGITGYPVTLRIPESDLFIKFSNMKSNVK